MAIWNKIYRGDLVFPAKFSAGTNRILTIDGLGPWDMEILSILPSPATPRLEATATLSAPPFGTAQIVQAPNEPGSWVSNGSQDPNSSDVALAMYSSTEVYVTTVVPGAVAIATGSWKSVSVASGVLGVQINKVNDYAILNVYRTGEIEVMGISLTTGAVNWSRTQTGYSGVDEVPCWAAPYPDVWMGGFIRNSPHDDRYIYSYLQGQQIGMLDVGVTPVLGTGSLHCLSTGMMLAAWVSTESIDFDTWDLNVRPITVTVNGAISWAADTATVVGSGEFPYPDMCAASHHQNTVMFVFPPGASSF